PPRRPFRATPPHLARPLPQALPRRPRRPHAAHPATSPRGPPAHSIASAHHFARDAGPRDLGRAKRRFASYTDVASPLNSLHQNTVMKRKQPPIILFAKDVELRSSR